ncbi:MAG: DUF4340 domain-containing protein [Puniceicoccaceae bacterium]
MRFRLTIILAVLNFIVFGTIYYLEFGPGSSAQKLAPSGSILGSEILKATRIEISGPSLPFGRVLEREKESWIIRQPVQWRANPNAIDRILNQLVLLRNLASFSVSEVRSSGQTLADYGLSEPTLNLSIEVGNRTIDLAVGSPPDVKERFYLLVKTEEKIFVIDQELFKSIVIDIGDLQDNNLFAFDLFSVNRFSFEDVERGTQPVQVHQIGDSWFIEAPISSRANDGRVDARLNAVLNLQINRFLVGEVRNEALAILESPEARLVLQTENATETLLLSEPPNNDPEAPTLLAKFENNPTVFTISAAPFAGFSNALDHFRERNIMTFLVEQLDKIEVAGPLRKTTIQRLENKLWQVVSRSEGADEPTRFLADPLIVADAMDSLLGLRVVSFVDDAPTASALAQYGLLDPFLTISTRDANGQEQSLLLGAFSESDQLLFAKRLSEPFVFKIPLDPVRILPLNPLHYRIRLLRSVPDQAILTEITLEEIASRTPILRVVKDIQSESWISKVAPLTPEQLTPFAIIEAYAKSFRVGTYLGDQVGSAIALDGEEATPWTYQMTVSYQLPGSSGDQVEELRYLLTSRTSGTLQAGASVEDSLTFTLPLELIEALAAFLTELPSQPIFEELEAIDRDAKVRPLLEELLPDGVEDLF